MKQKIIVLKFGGSVVTQKGREQVYIRKQLLTSIAKEIKRSFNGKNFQLILIHGAGSAGHQLAHKYGLKNGAGKDIKKWKGSIVSRLSNQKLNTQILDILIRNNLPVISTHTSTILIQKEQKIFDFNLVIIQEALKNNCIPLLYGEMVFDKTLGMTICSGDAIAAYLAKKFPVERILFASDVDGIFDQDPYLNKKARLIENIKLKEIFSNKIKLSRSHNVDTTGGIAGKLKAFSDFIDNKFCLKEIVIFNGFKQGNYEKVLLGKNFKSTIIKK